MPGFAELLNPVHSPEKIKVLEAIASQGPRIVPVDVASTTGMALPAVMSELNKIASETNAHLEVTEAGSIAYQFQPNLQQAYRANAGREIMLSIWRVIANLSIIVLRAFCALMFFLVRISFGIALVGGCVLIVVLVIVGVLALLRGLGGDSDGGGGDGGGFDFDFGSLFDFGWGGGYYGRPLYMYWLWDWLWDWFFFWRYVTPDYSNYQPQPVGGGYDAGYGQVGGQKEKRRDFLSNVFSYLFGDGDPNKNYEELEWQALATAISDKQGVVTAEQLAPYAGEDPKDEDWMVHVLQRFNGSPEVSESGGIIYVFPDFQRTQAADFDAQPDVGGYLSADHMGAQAGADLNNLYRQQLRNQSAQPKRAPVHMHLDNALTEKTWPFMTVESNTIFLIVFLSAVLVCGSYFLLSHALTIPFMPMLSPLIWGIFSYGLLLFVIPGVRYCVYRMINDKIDSRNEARLEYAAKLANPTAELAQKLADAKDIRVKGLPKGGDKTVYSTDKDLLDQPDLDQDDDYRLPPGKG